ncbi:MAG: putative nuclear exosomal helicase [Frankiales bacterium]|nr:putative nuclear exosomal helicase [Frankiales bacterium]
MSSPSERYSAFRANQGGPRLAAFELGYPFGLDGFQRTACKALEAGRGVLVAAPTGAGKTVVGEFAVFLALAAGGKCFYTTPIKALSNQKYADLVARHGPDKVGLLTGDSSINGSADVVVMTTEVLRNMLYSGSDALRGLVHVVMDEVHYLADRARGAVWEEVIIHLPEDVQLTSLSATVSNAEEFADWLVTVRGDTEVVVEEHRPVPLFQHVLMGSRLFDLFDDRGEVHPELVRRSRDEDRWKPREKGGRPQRPPVPRRPEVIERLDREHLLPAITFIFSRAGCAAAVEQCLKAGLRLNSTEERERVRAHVERRTADIPREDLRVLGYWEWLEGLERGLAAHHAGMLPTFKEIVEELFLEGLVKAVFATETLALGINMPARSVVLEKLVKWNGEAHVDVTPGEYTQLTGRAGRRGIDVEGHAVVLWQPGFDPRQVAGLASTRTYPLRSSFRPSYNMAVNLVGSVGRESARALLESSFAQFQADRSVVGLARQVTKNLDALDGYREGMTCHLGDAVEYDGLRQAVKRREAELARQGSAQRRLAAALSLEALKVGDVIAVPHGRRAGLAVVIDPGVGSNGQSHPLVVTEDRWSGRLSDADFPGPVEPLGHVRVPKNFNARSQQARKDMASSIRALGVRPERTGRARSAAADDARLASLRQQLRQHPVHGCDDREQHLRWAERWARLRQETDALERKVEGKTHSIARVFDRVCGVLEELGYLSGDEVTASGSQLARVYNEADLLVVECLRAGLWDGLSAAELAAVASALVYESRRPEEASPQVPGGPVRVTLDDMSALWGRLRDVEGSHSLAFLREPDAGFTWAAWRWAGGAELEQVLDDDPDLTAGDFVRWCKQLVDLLGQVALIAEGPVRETARTALAQVRRGVVSYTSLV